MKTIWFCGENEEQLISIAETLGEELINRSQNVEIIVQNEVQEILGKGLENEKDKESIFTDRLGFLGHLLHRNGIFALIISNNSSVEDRRKVKEEYGNYIQINIGAFKDLLCDLDLSIKDDVKANAKKIIEYLILEKIILHSQGSNVYSKDEEEEIRKRLEDLGYV